MKPSEKCRPCFEDGDSGADSLLTLLLAFLHEAP